MIDVDQLIVQARDALQVGDRLVARGYWRRAARLAPDRLDIWLDLYQVTDLPADRERCLQRIVDLDPTNVQAQTELERMVQSRSQKENLTEQPSRADMPNSGNVSSEAEAALLEKTLTGIRLDVTDEMRRAWDEAVAQGKPLVCIDHPQREATLRCNRCDAPICTKCAVRTPVGFRCKACIRAQQSMFFNAHWYDYPVSALISLLMSVFAAILAGMAGWWFALIISPFAGGLIGGVVHWAVGRRRGRWLWLVVGTCMVLGALLALINVPSAFISIGIYAVAATSTAMGILRLGRSR